MGRQGKSAGSQLSQLKSSLRTAGLTPSFSKPKKGKGKGKAGADGGRRDVDARKKKLEEIAAGQNLFDTKSVRSKFAVGGQHRPTQPISSSRTSNSKPTPSSSSLRISGRPAQSRSRAEQIRRDELLPEYLSRHRNSSFVDRRFSSGPATADDAALERFVRERQERFERKKEGGEGLGGRKGKRKVFNLDDDEGGLFDEEGLGGGAGGSGGLTHGGRALELSDDDDPGGFQLTRAPTSTSHAYPPSSSDEDGEDGPKKKKSKAEVMSELISKSKYHKYQRQKGREEDEEERLGLDEELKEIRGLLAGGGGGNFASGMASKRNQEEEEVEEEEEDDEDEEEDDEGPGSESDDAEVDGQNPVESSSKVDRALLARLIGSPTPEPEAQDPTTNGTNQPAEEDDDDDAYDRYVRELAFEARAKPSDRLLTASEKALEEAEKLRALEVARRKRMLGLADDDEEDGGKGKGGKKGRGRGRAEADDLEDDYVVSGDEGEEEAFEVGEGLRVDGAFGGFGVPGAEEDDGVGDEDDEDDEHGDEDDEEDEDIDLEELEGEDLETASAADGPSQPLVTSSSTKSRKSLPPQAELAYTYPIPASHADFLSTLASTAARPSDVPTVVSRIRTLYHPSLAPENNDKLAVLGGVVLDHIIYLSSKSDAEGGFEVVNGLVEHLVALTKAYPQQLASHFVSKLALMHRNLLRALVNQAQTTTSSAVKVFPGVAELTVLRLVGSVWSSSDFSHPVCAPAGLLMGQYLAQARVRTMGDLASGVFLCPLFLQYESMSKRLVPEAVNFLANALLLLLPTDAQQPGTFPLQEVLEKAAASDFTVSSKSKAVPGPLSLRRLLGDLEGKAADQAKIDLLDATLSLVSNFATLYASLDAFIEVFSPFESIFAGVSTDKLPAALLARFQTTSDGLSRQLKFARQSRKPLRMQHHRAIPIPSLAPAFDDSDPTKRRWDPDTERAEANKLRALLKKEKKGAVRELRKDNRFLAAQKYKEKQEEDQAYNTKIARITAGLQEERAEEKKMDRTKMRIKRQDKARRGGGGGGRR